LEYLLFVGAETGHLPTLATFATFATFYHYLSLLL